MGRKNKADEKSLLVRGSRNGTSELLCLESYAVQRFGQAEIFMKLNLDFSWFKKYMLTKLCFSSLSFSTVAP